MSKLKWKRLPDPFPNMEAWGAMKRGVSFVVSFDHEHPECGFGASYQRRGSRTIYLDGSFVSMERAREAVATAYERSKQ